jgi:glucosamine-6-phosphate deaminase
MRVIVADTVRAFDREAALFITRQALIKPGSFFAFATGDTTKNIYALVSDLHRELGVDYSACKACNLDEYAGVDGNDQRSCGFRIRESILNRINLKGENIYTPNGLSDPAEKELGIFKETIEGFGGIDLLVLGIGNNGHIGFNEPGTPFDSSFRLAPLSEKTRIDKSGLFGGEDKVPRYGITMGIRDIMMARRILLVAKGQSKAEAVRSIVNGPLTEDMPATVTRLHPDLVILVDREAASFISLSR